jgi:hypothetical protein
MWFLGLTRDMSPLEDLRAVALFKVVPERIGLGLDAQIGFSQCLAVYPFCFVLTYRVSIVPESPHSCLWTLHWAEGV